MALKMPSRFRLPPELEESMLICELGLPPSEIDRLPQPLIERILIYKGVKGVTENGGDWQP